MRSHLRRIAALAIGLASGVGALMCLQAGWLQRLEYVTWDLRQRTMARPAPPHSPIKLIVIDQASLDWSAKQVMGWGDEESGIPWPWPRELYKPIIDFCVRGGAKVIVLDFFFPQPSAFGVTDDEQLAGALRDAPGTVLGVPLGGPNDHTTKWRADVPASRFAVSNLDRLIKDNRAAFTAGSATFSQPEIASAVTALGHVRGDQDEDSIIRRVRPIQVLDGQVLPFLSLAAWFVGESREAGKPFAPAPMRLDAEGLHVASKRVPLDDSGRTILRFRQPRAELGGRMYPAYSAAAVIDSQISLQQDRQPLIPPDVLKDCYVLIGPTAAGLYDLKPTPMNSKGPGVEVHATFLDNMIGGDFLSEPAAWTVWLFTIALACCGALGALSSRNGFQVVLVFAASLPIPAAAGFGEFALGLWWPIVAPQLALTAALFGGLIANYAGEGRQRRFIKRSFQFYLSPVVIEQILHDPSRLRLGGERRELSILFSDLAGFSTIAEKLDPQALAGLLNEYLTDMTDIILDEDGTLDKYEGDAIIAFWNAPLDQPDHALRACRAAIRCQQALARRRRAFHARAGVDLHMRIGIHTGPVSVGNFGSLSRFDYTIIGHAANLASRLEGANKFFGTSIIASHDTWSRSGGEIPGREIGLVRVVGIASPMLIHELIWDAAAGTIAPGTEYASALALCRGQRCDEALAAFERWPEDSLARKHAELLRAQRISSGVRWDGVWNLAEK